MFSAINSRLLRLRSVKVLTTWVVSAGLVHGLNRDSTQFTPFRMACAIFLNTFSTINSDLTLEECHAAKTLPIQRGILPDLTCGDQLTYPPEFFPSSGSAVVVMQAAQNRLADDLTPLVFR